MNGMYKKEILFVVALIALLAAGLAIGTEVKKSPAFGTFSPTGGQTYRIASSIGTSNTTIKLSTFKEPVSNIPYTMSYLNSSIEYGTVDPQTTRSEFVSFTGITQNSDGSATLTGVVRGLTRTPAGNFCTASTTLAQSHPGQSAFILSNSPCFYSEYTPLRNNATSSAILTFSSTTPPRLDNPAAQSTGSYIATPYEFATIAYVNGTVLSGAANATELVKGIIELATAREAASSTVLGGTGANLVLQTKYATDTPQLATCAGSSGCLIMTDLLGSFKVPGIFGVATSSPGTAFSIGGIANFVVGATSTLYTNLILPTITATSGTSTFSSLFATSATTTNFGVGARCNNCISDYIIMKNQTAGPNGAAGVTATVTATCPAGTKVLGGGGYDDQNGGQTNTLASYPSATSTWTYTQSCREGGGCSGSKVYVFAICATN